MPWPLSVARALPLFRSRAVVVPWLIRVTLRRFRLSLDNERRTKLCGGTAGLPKRRPTAITARRITTWDMRHASH